MAEGDPGQAQEPAPAQNTGGVPGPPPQWPGPAGPPPYGAPGSQGYAPGGPPAVPPQFRVHAAWQRRTETDYIFDYWTALGWTLLTLGIFGFYVLYQLVRRIRDHNVRRLELLDASLAFAWEEAGRRGLQGELTPSFQRASAHMDVMRRMTSDFRDPAIWVVLSIVARGLVDFIVFVLLDQDLVKHDRSEVGVEYELALIFGRFGQAVPTPDQNRVKQNDNYAGRIVAAIVSLGIYFFWWYRDQMAIPNRHFEINWVQEDALANAVGSLAGLT